MKELVIAALTLPLAGAAFAQSADISTDVDDVEIMGSNNEDIGDIETVLLDDSGQPVAYVVEIDDGFLDLGDSEVVMNVDDLTWEGGHFATSMTADEVEQLPTWDD